MTDGEIKARKKMRCAVLWAPREYVERCVRETMADHGDLFDWDEKNMEGAWEWRLSLWELAMFCVGYKYSPTDGFAGVEDIQPDGFEYSGAEQVEIVLAMCELINEQREMEPVYVTIGG